MLFQVAKGLKGDPELACRIMLKTWPSRILNPPVELPLVAGDQDTWRSQLELVSLQPQKDKQAKANTSNSYEVNKINTSNFFLNTYCNQGVIMGNAPKKFIW